MTEWNIAALIIEKWGVPGLIVLGIAWVMYRFGAHPSRDHAPASDPIADIARKLDAHHAAAEIQRKEVTEALHRLDNRLVVIETTLDVSKR